MGILTLADFRTDLQSALGDRGIGNARLDRWINFGYLDLAGSVDFATMDANTSTNTVNATQTIAVATNALFIKFIKDTTSDALLAWTPSVELFRRNITPTAQPDSWTREGDSIYLHPVPDGVYALVQYYKKPPTVLSASGDKTVFADTWDDAVYNLAVHHALLVLNEEQRATVWLARAISYIGSRITEADYHGSSAGLGASLATGFANLQARLAAAQLGNIGAEQ